MRPEPGPGTAAVATPHPAAAAAGRDLLQRGGNAVDAAVGAMLACCVAMPGSVGLGGYGGSLVAHLAEEGTTVAINFDSHAPAAFREELYQGQPDRYFNGYLATSVPAVVSGLALALERFGRLGWADALAPAIALAEQGVPITTKLKGPLDLWAKRTDPVSLRAWFPDGTVPEVGTVWVQHDMARLLRRLAAEGPGAFYRGEIPQAIVRQVREHGGILTEDDFQADRPEVVEPLAIDYRGIRVLTPPPPSGGLTSLQILKTLGRFELASLAPVGAEFFRLFVEAARFAWQDREAYLGDPEIVPIPVERLLSDALADERAARIQRGEPAGPGTKPPASTPHTANVLAADPKGNVVSLTATQGGLYGSSVVIEGLGLVMAHGMSRFTLAGGSPNAPAAGKRMFHNMAPMVLLGPEGKALGAVGLPGGTKIVTVSAQLVVRLVDFQSSPVEAVSAGRVHAEGDEPVAVSATVSDEVVSALTAQGYNVRRGQDLGGLPDEIGGVANALTIDPDTGAVRASSQAGADAALTFSLARTSPADPS